MKFCTIAILFNTLLFADYASASGGAEEAGKAKADAHGAEAAPPAPVGPSRIYHPGPAQPFPDEVSGIDLTTGKSFSVKSKKGRVLLVVFVASWCEPCQQIIKDLKNVTNKYREIYTDVVYVFSHDTKDDAKGFISEHKLSGRMTLASPEILKAFKNPQLPAVYVSDRYKFMGNRFLKVTPKDVLALESYMAKLTAL